MDTATHSADRPALPPVIARYQAAHDRRDTESAIDGFAPDATVLDDGQTYVGTDAIRSWLDHAASEYTFTRTLTGAEDLGDGHWIVRNRLEGDFPGAVVDLAYRFTLHGDLIAHLDIAP